MFSPDGKLIAAGEDSGAGVGIWDTNTGSKLHSLRGHVFAFSAFDPGKTIGSVCSVAFSPDGNFLASGGSDMDIIVWDTVRWEKLISLHQSAGLVRSVAFSPDGKMIAVGNGTLVGLWETATWRKLKELDGHSGSVSSVVFSNREKLLASGSADRTIIVWDIVTGNKLLTLDGKSRQVESVDISPDGKTLASGGNYPNIVHWDLSNGDLLKLFPSFKGWCSP